MLMAAILLFIGVSTSHADGNDSGFLVGASAGHADQKDACDDTIDSCDDDDLGWKVFAGYKINKHLVVEVGSVDFGEAEFDTPIINLSVAPPQIVPGAIKVEVDGFFLSGLTEWPVSDKFSVLAKLGMIYWDLEFSITDTADDLALIGDEDENGTDIFYGLGIQYKLTDKFSLRAEWERFNNIGSSETGTTDIDLFTAGGVMQF